MKGKLPNSFYKASIALIPKLDKDPTKKENQANIPDKPGCKKFSTRYQHIKLNCTLKRIIHQDQVRVIPGLQGYSNIWKKSMSYTTLIKKNKNTYDSFNKCRKST